MQQDTNIETFARQHRLDIERDSEDGTAIIRGRKGTSHLFEYDERRLGVAVIPESQTGHWWNAARADFTACGMQIRQNGDQEGTATFDPENPEQVRLALKYADVRPKRKVSERERQRLSQIGFKKPSQSVRPGPPVESGDTVGGEKTAQKRRARDA